MRRFDAMRELVPMAGDAIVVTNNGGASTEWAALGPPEGHLQVKTLGLCSSIGLGLALSLPRRPVVVFDGDGSLLMNLSTLPTIARMAPPNLLHVVFDNGVHEASGGTPTATHATTRGGGVDLAAMARAAGIGRVVVVESVEALAEAFRAGLRGGGPTFIHARVEAYREHVPPVAVDEVENKYRLIRHIERTEGISILVRPQAASQVRPG